MRQIYAGLLDSNWRILFLFYFLLSFLITFVDNEFITTDDIYAIYLDNVASEKYNDYDEFIEDFEEDLEGLDLDDEATNWGDIMYDILFILLESATSILIVSIILFGCLELIYNREEFRFSHVFKPVMIGNFIFLFPTVISILWFSFFKTDHIFEDILNFQPFYLSSLFDTDEMPYWQKSLLSLFNLYEIAFIFIVSVGIQYQGLTDISMKKIILNVVLIYGGIVVAWKSFVIYLVSTLG